MTKIYSPEELNSFNKETLVAVILSMQDQLAQLKYTAKHKYRLIFDRRFRRPVYTFVVFVLLRQISGSCPDQGSRSSIKR